MIGLYDTEELESKVLELRRNNAFVSRAFRFTDSELDALRLSVVVLAEGIKQLEEQLENSNRTFEWEITGSAAICPECKMIKEVGK